ncbi:hypothetical protein [Pseudoalteromonas sp. H105]|uniref:hypothetical protein n=1 Tax=Pseudoalteromonas sp. H105 TaxID=1348393 RepID=UPI0007321DFF|nr:hypothetical protein [Pseudoalteromonas sp. H105]KTF15724.1 hypothetical protein ATS75_09365 [Pseudoalteromonas sp. H105]
MHPRYAAIFGIENLALNQHFRPDKKDHVIADKPLLTSFAENKSKTDLLDISATLHGDINKAIAPQTMTQIIQSQTITYHNGVLSLPHSQLNPKQKRALWALLSDTLDNF